MTIKEKYETQSIAFRAGLHVQRINHHCHECFSKIFNRCNDRCLHIPGLISTEGLCRQTRPEERRMLFADPFAPYSKTIFKKLPGRETREP